ncbi:hypothetical protein CRM22_005055 [Opisthorchis felineus]|uniref:Uncharacterized protein n=1 Tax=Opisthorchis felineus TaxID=147828 RepID=A0A4S2LU61_OPIFE|nr:hypothetical protein CRM22_005055 [Opisthorchis felineus]
MRLNFKFSNLFGTAYKCGNILFTSNGCGLLSPVGNQINVYDLQTDESTTLDVKSFFNIRHMALSPSVSMLVAVNDAGEASIISLISGSVVSVYPLKHPVTALSFSPDGKFLAIAKGHCVMLFFAPGCQRQFNHLELYRVYYGFLDDVTSIDWSTDSCVFLAGCSDNSCRVFSVHRLKKLVVYTLSGHRNPVVGGFFMHNSLDVITVSTDGELCVWDANYKLNEVEFDDTATKGKVLFRLNKRYRYASSAEGCLNALVTAVSFHKQLRMLITGFDSGHLMLHTIPDFNLISEVKLFEHAITTLTINRSGEWIGAATEDNGQLTVWEWRSQTCHLKAQSHARQMTSLAYSPDGLHLVTGGQDAMVKVWRISGGRAVVTFSEHTAAVTGVTFPASKAKVVISSSLDGTVRAHDLVRYRNFRTLSVPTRQVQFACLAVDAPGSLVAAGGLDSFETFVWSVKTGVLLTALTGHTAPVSSLAFNPDVAGYSIELASVSWDGTLRLWDLTGNSGDEHNPSSVGNTKEVVHFSHDALCVAYRGDGKEIAISFLNGDVVFYDPSEGTEKGAINGKHDLGVAQTTEADLVTPKRSAQARKFQTIAYSADGEHLLAGGDSKYVCLYSIPDRVLLKRFEVTCNLSLDGVQEVHDRRRFLAQYSTEAVHAKLSQNISLPIPTSRAGVDRSSRQWRPEIHVSSVQFAPTGDAFAATTTEGVLVYSLASVCTGFGFGDHSVLDRATYGGWLFDAVGLDETATPENARLALAEGKQAQALDIAIRLRLHELVKEVMESIPSNQIDFLARQLPTRQVVEFVIPFLARQLSGHSRHVEFYTHWTDSVLRSRGLDLRRGAASWALAGPGNRSQDSSVNKSASDKIGFLSEHGEWASCQASLVRLQGSLEQIKTNVIHSSPQVFQCITPFESKPICLFNGNVVLTATSLVDTQFEAVSNLWRYLQNVAMLKATRVRTAVLSSGQAATEHMDHLDDPNFLVAVSTQLPKKKNLKTKTKQPYKAKAHRT